MVGYLKEQLDSGRPAGTLVYGTSPHNVLEDMRSNDERKLPLGNI